MNKPHKHCEVIKAYAEGETCQYRFIQHDWVDLDPNCADFGKDGQYRIKPPAPKWPETNLSPDFLNDAWLNFEGPPYDACTHIANLALCYSLETGQVVLPDAERDMKIAMAVRAYICIKGTPTDLVLISIVEACK